MVAQVLEFPGLDSELLASVLPHLSHCGLLRSAQRIRTLSLSLSQQKGQHHFSLGQTDVIRELSIGVCAVFPRSPSRAVSTV